MWDKFVGRISSGWECSDHTPEGVMENYHSTMNRLENVRERLRNPVSLKGGGPLKPATIRLLEKEKKDRIREVYHYRKLIKCLVKYNLLPTNKLISGKDRKQFVFSLWTMLELPELGKAVYYANRLIDSRYDNWTPSTNRDYAQWASQPSKPSREKKEERSREGMYDALINALNEAMLHIKKERQRLLFSGEPWKPRKNNSDITDLPCERQIEHKGVFDKESGKLKVIHGGQYKPPVKHEEGPANSFTEEFKAFLEKERK